MDSYLLGDTIRLKATILNMSGVEEAPASITVSVYQRTGKKLLDAGEPELTADTTAQYYYDWLIPVNTRNNTVLVAVWDWTGSHKKEIDFRATSKIN